ncbi:MAG: HD family hydrolase [Myxococcales bacterium]|nr:HD family hydrolase [Myxococcales bacterium]
MSDAALDVWAERAVRSVLALDPLSELPRTGWLLRGVRPCESIADHSFGVALVTMLLVDGARASGLEVDGERALRMAIVHDAPEARLGDVPMPVKSPALDQELARVERSLVEVLLGDRSLALWDELEAGRTLESRIVRVADKAHMMLKALSYERAGRGRLDEFWGNPKTFDSRGLAAADALFDAICAAAGRHRPTATTV